jgi:hypothetical protein
MPPETDYGNGQIEGILESVKELLTMPSVLGSGQPTDKSMMVRARHGWIANCRN